jgi:hypothetical protein
MNEAIQTYLKHGFNVIPVNQDKTPACDWKHFQNNKIEELGLFTTDCIGVVCGRISDNLEVLDFDNHGGTAMENLSNFLGHELIKPIYEKYKLPVVQTQSKGYHIYYRCDKIEGNQKLAMVNLYGKPDAIIETRGEGGYVLAPPTKGYQVIRNSFEDLQFMAESERQLLIEFAKTFNKHEKSIRSAKLTGADEQPGKVYDNTTESIEEAKDALISIGWTELGFNNSWRRPGKNKGISATFGNVASNVFYSFSSNIEYFDFETGYTPFQIVGLIKYNGDFSAFASELAKRYNLNKPAKTETKAIGPDSLIQKILNYKIDFNRKYEQPHFVLRIREEGGKSYKICSLGNFSAFTGKSKSRKSFARFFFEAAFIRNGNLYNRFISELPENKRTIVYIDTEQGISRVSYSAYRIVKLADVENIDNYHVYPLRDFTYNERCTAIEHIIKSHKDVGVVFIDGIADLAYGNNDEQEANRVVQLLMTWTAKYNIHICVVIHQPKSADWATGHLGSAIEKKAEAVINIKKDGAYSIFEARQMRNCADFSPFPFIINTDELPEIITEETEINQLFDEEI